MTLQQLLLLAINLSMGLIVLALGLHASLRDLTHLLRNPGLLVRSILAMNVIMPAFAVAVVLLFDLDPAVRIALVALALSPVPPFLPSKQTHAGGSASYVVGLLATVALLAIVIVPLGISVLAAIVGNDWAVPAAKVVPVVLISVLAPLILGVLVNHLAPAFAARISRPASVFGAILLVVALIPVLIGQWPAIVDAVGNGTLLALAIFTLVGVAVGHALGGPEAGDRTTLALATGARHPGVALAIASATFPAETGVFGVVLWHLVIGAIVSGPYASWRKRVHAGLVGAKP